MKEKLKTFAMMTVGVVLTTIGVYFFKIPNGFSTGGVAVYPPFWAMYPFYLTGTAYLCHQHAFACFRLHRAGKGYGRQNDILQHSFFRFDMAS